MLNIQNISKSFSGNPVLSGFSYCFASGGIYALMGANGSGKTTLFNLIGGFLSPDAGEIIFKGNAIQNHPPHRIASLGIARTFQDLRLLMSLTVEENIFIAINNKPDEKLSNAFVSHRRRGEDQDRVEKLLEQTHMADVRKQKAEQISYGQQKLLTLAMALANDSDVLLLDEPVAGVQPHYREEIQALLSNMKNTVIIIEHNPQFIKGLTDNILFLDDGAIIAEGDYDAIRGNPRVQEAYL